MQKENFCARGVYFLWKERITTTSRVATSLRKIFDDISREKRRHVL